MSAQNETPARLVSQTPAPARTSAIKVIATDLDGTLFGCPVSNNHHSISARTVRALDAARAQGIIVMAISARPSYVLSSYEDLCACVDLAMGSNGAAMFDVTTRVSHSLSTMDADLTYRTYRALRLALPNMAFALETGHTTIVERRHFIECGWWHNTRIVVHDAEAVFSTADQIIKLLAYDPTVEPDVLLAKAETLKLPGVELTHSGVSMLEISPAGSNKASALAAWCAERGISADEVIAFGDGPNDVPMLEWAGTSYAMANANARALEAAKYRTLSNLDDGVAVVIEELLGV